MEDRFRIRYLSGNFAILDGPQAARSQEAYGPCLAVRALPGTIVLVTTQNCLVQLIFLRTIIHSKVSAFVAMMGIQLLVGLVQLVAFIFPLDITFEMAHLPFVERTL
jgi:hypothetical protein